MHLNRKQSALLQRYALALLAVSGSVQAQSMDASGAAASGAAASDAAAALETPAMQKVIVTARRREETIQDVPVSVTAISADQISKQGIPDITALATQLPNTTLKSSRATNSTLTAFIRGVGQADPLAGFESGVGIYLDDVYLARPQGAVADIYDVERIEVLRGPQGTLYGRNTIGGAVKYVTRKLSNQPDLRLKGTFGSDGQADAQLTASMPLSSSIRVGGAIARFTRDGFGTNFATGRDNYDKKLTAARLSAEFTPTSTLFIRVAGDITIDDSNPKNGHRLIVGRSSGAPILANVYDTQGELTRALGEEQEVRQHGIAATVEYMLSPTLLFKSISATRHDKSFAPIDFDALPVVDFEVPAVYTNGQWSQEFQLTYTGDKVQGVAGVYYIDASAFNKFDTILAGAVPTSTFTYGDIGTRAWATFFDGSYAFNKSFSVSLGGRYTVDKRSANILRQIYFGVGGTPGMGNPGAVLFRTDTDLRALNNTGLEREDKKFTPRLALAYKINDQHNLYASYAQGFKGGGFDPRLNVVGTRIPLAQARAGYAPETIKTLELGLKSSFLNERLMTNIALFHSDYRDVQIPGSVAIDTNGDGIDDSFAGITTNAGKAKIKGLEIEAMGRVTPRLNVSGMFSIIDANYNEYIVNGVNVAAQRVFQNTPMHASNVRGSYDIPLTTGRLSLIGAVSYKGATNQFETTSILDQDAYYLVDASLVWTRNDGKLRAALHGKNLSDRHYKTAGYLFPTLGNEGVVTAFYGNPRQLSATLEYRF